MDLEEIQRHAFEGSDMYSSFEEYHKAEGEEEGNKYKITLLKPMKENTDMYIKSQGELMERFASGNTEPYTADEMHPK